MERNAIKNGFDAMCLEPMRATTEERFTHLYCSCYGQVRAYFVRSGCHVGDLDDLTQEVFARMWCRQEKMAMPEEQARSRLFGIARNVAREMHQKNRQPCEALLPEFIKDSAPTPLEHVQLLERAEAVRQAMTMLPMDQRHAVEMVEVEVQAPAQAAQEAGCSYHGFRHHRRTAVRHLAALLKIFFMLDFFLQLAQ